MDIIQYHHQSKCAKFSFIRLCFKIEKSKYWLMFQHPAALSQLIGRREFIISNAVQRAIQKSISLSGRFAGSASEDQQPSDRQWIQSVCITLIGFIEESRAEIHWESRRDSQRHRIQTFEKFKTFQSHSEGNWCVHSERKQSNQANWTEYRYFDYFDCLLLFFLFTIAESRWFGLLFAIIFWIKKISITI